MPFRVKRERKTALGVDQNGPAEAWVDGKDNGPRGRVGPLCGGLLDTDNDAAFLLHHCLGEGADLPRQCWVPTMAEA